MSGEIPERVTCEVCGTSFDPGESRGWCPNEACGKWQHPAFPLSDGAAGRGAADGGVNAPTKVCPSCGKDVRADANFCKFCSHEFPDEPAEPQEEDEPGLDACPDCGADLSSIPPDRLADCPICGTDLSSVLADQTEPDVTPADLTNCPACSADLTTIPADMRMVCPDCRVDLQEAIRTHGVGDDGSAAGDAATGTQQTGGQAAGGGGAGGGGTDSAGGAGPAGGAGGAGTGEAAESVDTIKGIGASYAERLSGAGVDTVGDLLRADLAELSAATDVSEKRLGQWVENAPLDRADLDGGASESTGTGQQERAGGGGAGGQQAGGEQQAGGSGHAGGQQAGGQSNRQQAGGQAGGTAGSQQGAGAGSATGGQQGGGGQGGQQGGGRQGGQQGGGRASSGQGGQQGGGRSGGRNQPTVPGSSSGGRGQGRGGAQQPSYSTVVFQVMGQEIRASPGDTVGREIRTAMVEGGAPDDDAVYVHREHVRVEREGDTFYLVRLGQNSLKVNGAPVGQHERAAVASGDEVSFSEVVTADVRLE